MLRRALNNLLSNAIRHTPNDQTVQIRLETSNINETCIIVENPGADIAPEHLPRLFDRFYSINPVRHRENSGAGLGLSIVKSIIDAHGGKTTVTSAAGIIRFQIKLPITMK